MQVLPFMPSLELYPRNSLLSFRFSKTPAITGSYRFTFALAGDVNEERSRLRRVVLDIPSQRLPYPAGCGDIRTLPPGEGGVSRYG